MGGRKSGSHPALFFHVSSSTHLFPSSKVQLNCFIPLSTRTVAKGPGKVIPGGNHSLYSLKNCCQLLSPSTLNCSWIPTAFWVHPLLQQNSKYRCWIFCFGEEKKRLLSTDWHFHHGISFNGKEEKQEWTLQIYRIFLPFPHLPSPFPTENYYGIPKWSVVSSPQNVF